MSGTGSCRAVETHVSTVFFVGDRVYKLKKPIRMPFLDYSTSARRREACHREVELNRRLADDVYLGVADVIGPDGVACDHLVVMRRLPEERRLSTLVRAGENLTDEITEIARRIAAFHGSLTSSSRIAPYGTRDAVRQRWEANFTELERFTGEVLDGDVVCLVRELAASYLAGRDALFHERGARGFIRDCHGDLLADDIFCLPDGPRILDCIEFDDSFRFIDVVEDVAFLAMDLERLGATDLAGTLQRAYGRFSAEKHPDSLFHHYVAYRALVRAKVACLRHEQDDDAAGVDAARLIDLALRHARRSQVALILVGGSPGTGKSTLSTGLVDAAGWMLLRSDEVRKELMGVPSRARIHEGYESGAYSAEATDVTYDAMLRRASALLRSGESVVLDASWSQSRLRDRAAEVALRTHSPLVELRCEAPPSVVSVRVAARALAGRDVSDATPAIADRMERDFDPWPGAAIVDTSSTVQAATATALAIIAGRLEAGALSASVVR